MRGRSLSQVQQLGVEILMLLEDAQRQREETERMRLALLTANPALARGLYPDYFEPEQVEESGPDLDLNREDASYDFRKVEWESPQNMADDEMEALRRLLGNANITVGTPVEAPEGMEEPSGLREPEDPEWT